MTALSPDVGHSRRHPGADALDDYSLDRLASDRVAEIEEHLLICRSCQRSIELVDTMRAALQAAFRAAWAQESVPMRILVVEDEPAICELVEALLAAAGHDVTIAADALDAVRKSIAPYAPFDLLITDLVLSGPSGYDLAVHVRSRNSVLRTLFLTGYGDDSPLVQYARNRSRGVTAFLRKPFTPDAFVATVNALIGSDGSGAELPGCEAHRRAV